MFELLTGSKPFRAQSFEQLSDCISKGNFSLTALEQLTLECILTIQSCLITKEEDRVSASELYELEFFSREAAEHHQFPEDFLSKQFGEKKKSKVLKETPRIRGYESMAHNLPTYKYKLSCSNIETLSLMKKTLQVLKEKE